MMKVAATSRLIARQICSMGLRSGEYGGRYTSWILFWRRYALTSTASCELKLSCTTISRFPGFACLNALER